MLYYLCAWSPNRINKLIEETRRSLCRLPVVALNYTATEKTRIEHGVENLLGIPKVSSITPLAYHCSDAILSICIGKLPNPFWLAR